MEKMIIIGPYRIVVNHLTLYYKTTSNSQKVLELNYEGIKKVITILSEQEIDDTITKLDACFTLI